jgi:dienelactone hydrolase
MSGQSSAQPQVARGASPYLAVVFRASVLLAVLWNSIPALAQTVYQPPRLVREFIKVPIRFDTGEVALRMMIVQPKGPGPFPLAVLSHGTTEGIHAYLRQGVHASTYSGAAIWFARRGWAVVMPVRRGFGGSDGVFSESTGACSTDGMADAGRSVAQDIRGAIDYMRRQPYVRDNEIISVGHSGGGWGSLALASDARPGVKAIISFAGGL